MKKGTRMADSLALGRYVLKIRNERGITAEELADSVGLSRTYVSKIERHGVLPSAPRMKAIADCLENFTIYRKYLQVKFPEVLKMVKETKNYSRKLCAMAKQSTEEEDKEAWLNISRRIQRPLKKESVKFGRYIWTLRKARGMRLVELAKSIGIGKSFLSEVENGYRWASLATLCRMVKTFEDKRIATKYFKYRYPVLLGILKEEKDAY